MLIVCTVHTSSAIDINAFLDRLVKSPRIVIPAKAGIYKQLKILDSAIKSRNDKW